MSAVRNENKRKFNAINVNLKDSAVQVKRVLEGASLKGLHVIKYTFTGNQIIAQMQNAMSQFRIFANELWRTNQWRTSIFINRL